ncbi:MAG: hypothetical protein WBP13_02440 [Methylophilaceae bacterium]
MTYSILFIDEQKSAHREFKREFLDNNKDNFTGSYILPEASLDQMIEVIYKINPDAILTDFSLNEYKTDLKYEVQYDGGDLANEIHARRQGFPVFITTSLGDDAAKEGADVKIIYEKYGSFKDGKNDRNETRSDTQHLTFSNKLYYEIKAYKQFLDDSSSEFDSLLEKRSSSPSGLKLEEEERLIQLDGILEGLMDNQSKIPEDLKTTSNAQKLEELLSLAKKIVSETQL